MWKKKILLCVFAVLLSGGHPSRNVLNGAEKVLRTSDLSNEEYKQLEQMAELINEDRYDEAVELYESVRSSFSEKKTGIAALYLGSYKTIYNYGSGLRGSSSSSCQNALESLNHVRRENLPEELWAHYDVHYREARNTCKEKIEKEKAKFIQSVYQQLDQITEDLKNEDMKSASKDLFKLEYCKINQTYWRDTKYFSPETIHLFDTLQHYYNVIHWAMEGDYIVAYCLFDMIDADALPKALKKPYQKWKTKIKEEYYKQYPAWLAEHQPEEKQEKKKTGQSHTYSGTYFGGYDDYDVDDYDNPDDFYEANKDSFDSFEDAEDYFYEYGDW